MRVLQINGYESPGKRFSGLSLAPLLKKYDIESTHMIWERDTEDPLVKGFERKHARKINNIVSDIENTNSLQSVLFSNGSEILNSPAYADADLIHLHLIHTGYFSLIDLQKITRSKPTVWTLHDPWAFTGHCIYPFECTRWQVGCGHCPDLNLHFPMRKDNTALMFDLKRYTYSRADFEVIVASKWMAQMTQASPLFQGVRVHQIPFGLDLAFFDSADGKKFRQKHDISDDSIVLCFRAQTMFKGLEHIVEALDLLKTDRNICLVTVGNKNLVDRFAGRFQLVELGWVNDAVLLRDAMASSDMFLMPSTAEAFGVMAIEAMACGKPVICFAGTSLPDVTGCPHIGVAVPMRDSRSLADAIAYLIDHPDEKINRGKAGLAMVKNEYDENIQVRRISEAYRAVIERRTDRIKQ